MHVTDLIGKTGSYAQSSESYTYKGLIPKAEKEKKTRDISFPQVN